MENPLLHGSPLPSDSEEEDKFWMQKALQLAKLGEGRASPHPLVGAVVVKNKRLISIGYHAGPGTKHAERMALELAGKYAEGADLYINLEPCIHRGRTPPCAPFVVSKKIKKVIIGIKDPDKRVNGKGIEYLRKNGVEVKLGVLEKECYELNKFYFTYKIKKRPFIALKFAMTIDGKISFENKNSKWISSEEQREFVHYIRGNFDAIAVGKNTFLKDNPLLTPRKVFSFRTPYRFILWGNKDFELKNSKFFKEKNAFICVSEDYKGKKYKFLLKLKGKDKINLKNFIQKLYEMEITSILIEGGAKILTSFVKDNLFDEIHTSYSGKIAGKGLSPFDNLQMKGIIKDLEIKEIYRFKNDVYIIWKRKDEN